MFKVLTIFLSVYAYGFALHNFLPSDSKKGVYTNFVPPSAERFFAAAAAAAPAVPQIPTTVSAKAVAAAPFVAPYLTPYASPYAYQAPPHYSPAFGLKQYPYYPGAFYPPQQYVYPGALGPSPVVYVPRYPAPAEGGNEQGGAASGSGWGSYFPSNWQQWGSYFPSFFGGPGSSEAAEGASPATPAESSQPASSAANNRGKPEKPEKLENAETPPQAQDSGKTEVERNTAQLPEQQYVVLGQPQFFGQFDGFPADRDPANLNGAAKGAVSSFLFYKDQNQQIVPQKVIEIPNGPGIASVAYQRFLLLSKQRSEEGAKPQTTADSQPKDTTLPHAISDSIANTVDTGNTSNTSNTSVSLNVPNENTPAKSSDGKVGDVAQVTPYAVAYAGIGGTAGAAPIGTAFIASNGLASSAPRATAIAGTSDQSPEFNPVPATRKISIARYTPQRKYHIDTVASPLFYENLPLSDENGKGGKSKK